MEIKDKLGSKLPGHLRQSLAVLLRSVYLKIARVFIGSTLMSKILPMQSLSLHPFRNKGDLESLFQAEIEKFPIIDGKRQIVEFGGILLRPRDQSDNWLSHIAFPKTVIGLLRAERSLSGHSSRTAHQIDLVAGADSSDLFIGLSAANISPDGLPELKSLLVPMTQVVLNGDIWATVSPEDQDELARHGFGPELSSTEWAQLINQFQRGVYPFLYPHRDGPLNLRKLPFAINKLGAVGTTDSFHLMPEFVASILEMNQFVFDGMAVSDIEEDTPYEIGSAHIHPANDFQGMAKDIAKSIGVKAVRLTPSPLDVMDMRQSEHVHSEILKAKRNRDTNTIESFLGIIGLDDAGNVATSRYLDFADIGDADELKRMSNLNDRTVESMRSHSPNAALIAEHYRYFAAIIKEDFGPGTSSEHVGDR